MDGLADVSIKRCKACTMSFWCKCVEQCIADKTPNLRGIPRPLTGAMDWCCFRMLVQTIWYSNASFKAEFCVGECFRMHLAYIYFHPHAVAGESWEQRKNAIVARCCIQIEGDARFHGTTLNFILHDLQKHWIKSGSTWSASVDSIVQKFLVFSKMNRLPQFNCKEKIIISFIQMDNS